MMVIPVYKKFENNNYSLVCQSLFYIVFPMIGKEMFYQRRSMTCTSLRTKIIFFAIIATALMILAISLIIVGCTMVKVYTKGTCKITNNHIDIQCKTKPCTYTGNITIQYITNSSVLTTVIKVFDKEKTITDAVQLMEKKYAINSTIICYYPTKMDRAIQLKDTDLKELSFWFGVLGLTLSVIYVFMLIIMCYEWQKTPQEKIDDLIIVRVM